MNAVCHWRWTQSSPRTRRRPPAPTPDLSRERQIRDRRKRIPAGLVARSITGAAASVAYPYPCTRRSSSYAISGSSTVASRPMRPQYPMKSFSTRRSTASRERPVRAESASCDRMFSRRSSTVGLPSALITRSERGSLSSHRVRYSAASDSRQGRRRSLSVSRTLGIRLNPPTRLTVRRSSHRVAVIEPVPDAYP